MDAIIGPLQDFFLGLVAVLLAHPLLAILAAGLVCFAVLAMDALDRRHNR